MKRNSYDIDKHGTSISLLRKAIESQLVLLTEPDLRHLLIDINRKLAGKAEPLDTVVEGQGQGRQAHRSVNQL